MGVGRLDREIGCLVFRERNIGVQGFREREREIGVRCLARDRIWKKEFGD